ncbi:MAG: septal ring lytic transglycosylase RlpA family protein [Chthoniobacterales bacterium]|nr:septal ring lytic transglycosylase RlpA family protein [Chthoniobacterales bacterium]
MRFLRPFTPAVAVCALLLASGCAAKKGLIVEPSKPEIVYDATPVSVLHGKASYYYGRWIGRLTANGETYRATDVTAAHKTLPFNTMVRVTNLKNGKSVIVRINNRGPYVKGRILDLSLVAAQKIEMTTAGVVPVKAEILKRIDVVAKPNVKLTASEKRAAEKRLAQAAKEAREKKAKQSPGLSKVFSFLRPAQ